MYIISPYHDYYDTALAAGIDKTVVYNRKTQVLVAKHGMWNAHTSELALPNGGKEAFPSPLTSNELSRAGKAPYYNQSSYKSDHWIIGFCGKLYPLIHLHKRSWGMNPISEHNYFYTKEQIKKYLDEEGIAISNERSSRYGRGFFRHNYSFSTEEGLNTLLDVSKFNALETLFQTFKTPVFLWGSDWADVPQHKTALVLNPNLKKLEFMQNKDPYTAFQDLYMYISGVLGVPANPTIEISDKDKAAAKGHDGEYSFKKPPGGGRWR